MADFIGFQQDMQRYAQLIEQAIPRDLSVRVDSESASAVQIERGLVYPVVLREQPIEDAASFVDRLIELATSPRLPTLAVVDASGYHRPVYRPLLVYSWLQAFRIAYEKLPRSEFGRWEEGLRPWCDLLEAELGSIDIPDGDTIPASRGTSVTEMAWTALALQIAGKILIRDAWTDLASSAFGRIVQRQSPGGAFLTATSSDNPETRWFHELILLHACSSYAVQAEDRVIAAAVARSTDFHQAETQSDHATTQPWGLFAFIWNDSTRPMADQMLHASQSSSDRVSAILLADALHCTRLFLA